MILADELNKLVTLDRNQLSDILAHTGYFGIVFKSVKFLGLTNGGDFCYSATYFDESGTGEETCKVFVSKDTTGKITADF